MEEELLCRPSWRRGSGSLACWSGYLHSGVTEWGACNPEPWRDDSNSWGVGRVFAAPRPVHLDELEARGVEIIAICEDAIDDIEECVGSGALHIVGMVERAFQDVVALLRERCLDRLGADGVPPHESRYLPHREVFLHLRGYLVSFELDPDLRHFFQVYMVDRDRDPLPGSDAEALNLVLSMYRDQLRQSEVPGVPGTVTPARPPLSPRQVENVLSPAELRAGVQAIRDRLRYAPRRDEHMQRRLLPR